MTDIIESTPKLAPFDVTDATTIEDAAAQYSRAGFNVVFGHSPVFSGFTDITGQPTEVVCSCGKLTCDKNRGKHPVLQNWQKIATSDPDLLRDQLGEVRARLKAGAKEPNIGWCLGAQPTGGYLVAIDVDDEGRSLFLQSPEQYGALPETLTCTSGRGKRQFYWLAMGQSGNHLANIAGLGGEAGVDVKVQAGYIVIAPSVHMSGALYQWKTPLGAIADLPPEWYLAISKKRPIPKDAVAYEPHTMGKTSKEYKNNERFLNHCVTQDCSQLARTSEGRRNHLAFATAVNLLEVASGVRLPGAWDFVLSEVRSAALSTGLASSEVDAVLKSAVKHVSESGRVRGPRPIVDFHKSKRPPIALVAPSSASSTSNVVPIIQPAEEGDYPRDIELVLDDARRPAGIAENVARLLGAHPFWKGGPAWDDFMQRVEWPEGLRHTDHVTVQGWLLSLPYAERVKAAKEAVKDGIQACAMRRHVDTLRQYVDALPVWDGTDRVERWLTTYCGAGDTPVHRRIGTMWLVSAIARAMEPGCGIEGMLILEDPSGGVGKNRFVKALFGDRGRTLAKLNFEQRDSQMKVSTTWCVHDDELSGFEKNSLGAVQSWLTLEKDTYVPKYSNLADDFPRRCVFLGSTNRANYLPRNDRRFWPVRIERLDVEAVARDREQLFAEAKALYLAGVKWYIPADEHAAKAEIAEGNESRQDVDISLERIAALLAPYEARGDVSVTTLWLSQRLGLDNVSLLRERGISIRIGNALCRLGYDVKWRCRLSGSRQWFNRKRDFGKREEIQLVDQVVQC
jgi:hypothetical protein